MYQEQHRQERARPIMDEVSQDWAPRRKMLVIAAASLLAWAVWIGAGLLVWRIIGP
jgi:hypothetical protein